MLYDFKFYQGKNTGICAKYNKLGLGESVMMRVVENLPQMKVLKFILIIFHWYTIAN